MSKAAFPIAVFCCVIALAGTALAAAPLYTIRELGLPSTSSYAGVLNGLGQAAFTSSFNTDTPPYFNQDELYFFNGNAVHQLSNLGGASAQFLGINNHGVAVGLAASADTIPGHFGPIQIMRAVKYQNGQLQDIGAPNVAWSGATAINDAGRILGYYYDDTGATELFVLDPTQGFEKLPNFGSTYDYPHDINNAGAMLITSYGAQTEQYGDYLYNTTQTLIYQNGNIVRLPGLGHDMVTGEAINDLGQVAGVFSVIPNQEDHAFVWDPTHGATDIGKPGESSAASDINNNGVVVGSASAEAFIYDAQNGRRRLADLLPPNSGWSSLRTADAINDAGQILGIGADENGFRVYLMTPVPEPTTFTLTALAFLPYLIRRHPRANSVQPRSGDTPSRSLSLLGRGYTAR